MNSLEILIVIATAAAGGLVAHMLWQLAGRRSARARPVPHTQPPAAEEVPRPAGARLGFLGAASAEAPATPDPVAQALRDLRADIAQIARAQIALIEGQGEREAQLLSELRAVASAPDPEIAAVLRRIEAALGSDDATEAAAPTGERVPDAATAPPPRPAARPEAVVQIDGEPDDLFPASRQSEHSLVSLLARARAEDDGEGAWTAKPAAAGTVARA